MQKFPRLIRSFTGMTDNQFNEFSQGVISNLTSNQFFPGITADLKRFKTAYDKYFNSIPARNLRNSVNTTIKNTNKEQAVFELMILSFQVEYQAKFNLEALESSGFDIKNKSKAKGQVGLPKNIQLKTNGVEGLVMASCTRDANATTYKARVSIDQVNWTWVNASSKRTVKIHNVPRGVKLYVQMQLENAHGFSPWSGSVLGEIPADYAITSVHE